MKWNSAFLPLCWQQCTSVSDVGARDGLANRNAVKLANHSTGFPVNRSRRDLFGRFCISGPMFVTWRKLAKKCRQGKSKHVQLEDNLFELRLVWYFYLWQSRHIKRSEKMEPYESDTEGEDQETLLLPRGHEVKFPKAHKGIFCWFVSCSRL